MYIIFDTETTGLPKNWNLPYTDTDNWPRCIQIAWQLHDEKGRLIEAKDYLIRPDKFDIPYDAEKIHGISTLLAQKEGIALQEMLEEFEQALDKAEFIIGQNVGFDINIMGAEYVRQEMQTIMHDMPVLDTCTETTANLCRIPGGRGGKFKFPTLTELHQFLFNHPFGEAHNATADVEATARCFFELVRRSVFTVQELHAYPTYLDDFIKENQASIQPIGLKHVNLKEKSLALKKANEPEDTTTRKEIQAGLEELKNVTYISLHNHTQYSILQSTSTIPSLIEKAASYNMPALALTDIGNMMGAFHFEKFITAHNQKIKITRKEAEEDGAPFHQKEITPIIGGEFYVCEDHLDKTHKDDGYLIVFLAKNKNGYRNLTKMASIAFTKGKYYVPRIDKKIVDQYKDDLIVLSGNMFGEIPHKILNLGEKQAEEALLWWKSRFGDDFYLEIMRHGQDDEERANATLIKFSKTHHVKLVATNNSYYTEQEEADAHDILLCIKDGAIKETPIGRGRGFRYGLANTNYYFRSPEEMKELFADLPEAIISTQEIANKCEHYHLANDILLPAFEIPEQFKDKKDDEDGGKRGENNYLRHLTYEGAKKRYGEVLSEEVQERLDFELSIIEKTGYPGYFLIVQDFCTAARKMGVIVGPGRGSAAGSAVAYCCRITNIDPIKYDLLFERFLNPDRVSMPDIDIDFDDEGRGKIINWVIEKYGANQVAQIITWGTLAAKSSIRDTARALNLSLMEADYLAKLIPDISLKKIFNLSSNDLADKLKHNNEDINMANELISISHGNTLQAKVINNALKIEGCVRNTGIHACGVIITPKDITDIVPVALAKDTDMYCTQFDNSVVEEAGLLKMDFLGLKTLTLIKDTFSYIKEKDPNFTLTPDEIPLDDEATYALFQRGETIGVFQYESAGMQKYLRELQPSEFADLIAMNALYRPGPIEYIPSFIKRKHGEEDIIYDDPDMEEYLKETYGITVYQEQVMLLSQKLAGFTKGEADTLRKAMGKKKFTLLEKMKPQFLNQGEKRGHDKKVLEKVWIDWEKFASYAFNKSHSTCYAWIAYQTAYLKANYPAEYMAAVLSNNMSDIKSVTFFMEECKRMEIKVLGPDINESALKFAVNTEGEIRFGLGGIKGVGESPVASIIEAREEGNFRDIFDFTRRVNLRKCNKRALESLVLAGAFDSFITAHRAQYFVEEGNTIFLTKAMKFGQQYKDNLASNQASLFGEGSGVEIPTPIFPKVEEWNNIEAMRKEKEVIGIYISGHPLDEFKADIAAFCNGEIAMVNNPNEFKNREFSFGAIITNTEHKQSKRGNMYGVITFEDYSDASRIALFGQNYGKFKEFMVDGNFVYVTGKIQQSKWAKEKDDYQFEITKIEMLPDLRAQKTKFLEIKVNLDDITSSFINEVEDIFKEHEGNFLVKFIVYDKVKNLKIEMPSRNVKIDISNALFKKLDAARLIYRLI